MGFNEGLSAVENEGKYGYIDINNKLVIPYEYDSTISFTEGLAAVEKNEKFGFIDRLNNIIKNVLRISLIKF